MIALNEVPVSARTIDDLIPHLELWRRAQLRDAADGYDHARTIWHISSTAQGGGVAEMLRPLVGYGRALGLPTASPGFPGTVAPWATPNIRCISPSLPGSARPSASTSQPGTACSCTTRRPPGSPPTRAGPVRMPSGGRTTAPTCPTSTPDQPGSSFAPTSPTPKPSSSPDRSSRPLGCRSSDGGDPPLIDPASPKNQPMSNGVADSVLAHCGLLGERPDQPAPTFTRFDGDAATAALQPLIIHEGPAPHPDTPMIVQVSRWDRVKDMAGVMRGFTEHIAHRTDATLLLIGPEVDGVADDPEAAAVFADCVHAWQALGPHLRSRVQLVCLPMTDPEANAAVVNAAQQHATVAVQKSYSEGFGLIATEAMWKAKPLVTTAVGGLSLQVPDTSVGTALTDPDDLASFGAAVIDYLDEPDYRGEVGRNARASVRRQFLPDAHFLAELALLSDLNEKVLR